MFSASISDSSCGVVWFKSVDVIVLVVFGAKLCRFSDFLWFFTISDLTVFAEVFLV